MLVYGFAIPRIAWTAEAANGILRRVRSGPLSDAAIQLTIQGTMILQILFAVVQAVHICNIPS
eukprot:7273872-Karenia_brevis.AAC.1